MGWSEWFAALGIDNTARRQPVRVNNYPTLLQAAVAGQGIALGWRHLVDDFISAGSLVPALDVSVPGPGAFFISSSRPLVEGQPVTRLMNWLENKARPAT